MDSIWRVMIVVGMTLAVAHPLLWPDSKRQPSQAKSTPPDSNIVPAFTEIQPGTEHLVVAFLDKRGIPNRLNHGGRTVEVAAPWLKRAKIELAMAWLPKLETDARLVNDCCFGCPPEDVRKARRIRHAVEYEVRQMFEADGVSITDPTLITAKNNSSHFPIWKIEVMTHWPRIPRHELERAAVAAARLVAANYSPKSPYFISVLDSNKRLLACETKPGTLRRCIVHTWIVENKKNQIINEQPISTTPETGFAQKLVEVRA